MNVINRYTAGLGKWFAQKYRFSLIVGFSRFHKFVLLASRGRFMSELGKYPVLIIHSKGRITGKIRRTPIIYMTNDNDYVCVGSFGGSPKDPEWVQNLHGCPEVELEMNGKKIFATAEFVSGLNRNIMWENLVNFYSGFGYYQSMTSRCIPIIKFTTKV